MTFPWLCLFISAAIKTGIALLLSVIAARVRFSASRGLRWTLDIIFFLPLALPLHQFIGGSCHAFFAADLYALLPVIYFCGIMGFRNVPRETLEAAKLQGMGRCGTFWRFFVPAGWKWLLGGVAVILARLVLGIVLFATRLP
jgi:ABC-type proline/glycine betaine transport system permease subunit